MATGCLEGIVKLHDRRRWMNQDNCGGKSSAPGDQVADSEGICILKGKRASMMLVVIVSIRLKLLQERIGSKAIWRH